MTGFLPGARPTAANYGREVRNEKPVRNSELEADATDYNNVRADVAYVASLSALARISVGNNGAVSKVRLYKINTAYVTLALSATGIVLVTIDPLAGILISDAHATAYRSSASKAPSIAIELISTLSLKVHTQDDTGLDINVNFLLSIY